MPFYLFHWTDEIADYLAQHDVSTDDFENAVCHPIPISGTKIQSHSSGRPCCYGFALDGRLLFCIYELDQDGISIEPVSAYEVRR